MDISSLDDLKRKLRQRTDLERDGHKADDEAEEDIEEWLAVVMARLQGKSETELAEMVKQAAEKGQSRDELRDESVKKS